MSASGRYRPLKILHVIDSEGLYGAERVLLSLATECRKQGDEVYVGTIVAPQDQRDALGEEARNAGLEHVQFHMKDGLNLTGLRNILRFARDRRIDVIHTHGYKANILLGLAPRRQRPPVLVCTLHGWTSNGRPGKLALYEWLEKRIVRRFDKVVVVSEKMRDALRHRRLNGRLVKISNGVVTRFEDEDDLARAQARGKSVAADDAKLILAAGRLSHEKGFDLLLEAISILKRQGVRTHLTIAGEGPERPALQKQINDNALQDDVDLMGFQQDLSPFFRYADLFVLSSRTEGLPLVLLEAMARGVLVVSTPVGEIPRVLNNGQYGVLTRQLTAQSLSESIRAALDQDDQTTKDITLTARKRIEQKYSVTAMGRSYREHYEEALHSGR